jgi:Zn-dependent protease
MASLYLAGLVGIINILQLLPILPLDGGHILRSMVQSFSPRWAQRVLLVVAGLAVTALAYDGWYLFAGIAGLGALQAWHLGSAKPTARPLSMPGLVVIALGFGLTSIIHLAAIGFGAMLLGYGSI